MGGDSTVFSLFGGFDGFFCRSDSKGIGSQSVEIVAHGKQDGINGSKNAHQTGNAHCNDQ